MQILNVFATATAKAEVQKSIESFVFLTTLAFNDLSTEEISIQVERNGGSNLEITQGFVNLKRFLAAATFGDDAITSLAYGTENYATCAVVEITQNGALPMGPNDKLKIELKGLNVVDNEIYVIDGIESPLQSEDVYMYEEKSIADEQTNYDLQTVNYDIAVIELKPTITEINFTYDNGVVTKHSIRELIAISQDIDPVAYVSGTKVASSFTGILQFPMKGIVNMNFRKTAGEVVKVFFRKDVDLLSLGLIR